MSNSNNKTHRVFIALGSNLGAPEKNIKRALHLLKQEGLEIIGESHYYKTRPYGFKEQADFINSAVLVKTSLSAKELFLVLKNIEKVMGRVQRLRYGPRVIDLDIIFFDALVYQDAVITIPHPKMQERSFVLYPLCDIDKDFVHPLFRKSLKALKDELKEDLDIKRAEL